MAKLRSYTDRAVLESCPPWVCEEITSTDTDYLDTLSYSYSK